MTLAWLSASLVVASLFTVRHLIFIGNAQRSSSRSRLLLIGGDAIDTEVEYSVLSEWPELRRQRPIQWYAQLNEEVDIRTLEVEVGITFSLYIPHNGYFFVATQELASKIARRHGVVWVGRRPVRHKLSKNLDDVDLSGPTLKRFFLQMLGVAVANVNNGNSRTVLILLIPSAQRCEGNTTSCSVGRFDSIPLDSWEIVSSWNLAWQRSGIAVQGWAVSDRKAFIQAESGTMISRAIAWLSDRPEVFWIERQINYGPLNAASERLLANGPDVENMNIPDGGKWNLALGLNGTGQIIGIADTGIDMDSCFVWQSANNPSFPNRGVGPLDRTQVDMTRRKVIAYTYETNCSVCASCPVAITNDSLELSVFTLQARTAALELAAVLEKSFPADATQAALPPRLYSSAGATFQLIVQAVTQGCPSTYCGPGAGAFDVQSDIQVFIYERSVGNQVNPTQPEQFIDQCVQTPAFCQSIGSSNPQCICQQKANSFNWNIQLPGSVGGYTIFLVNAGAGTVPVNIKLQGSIQFLTANKPCGDYGDDRAGHGTHIVGSAAGSASTPSSDLSEMQAAAKYNGVASGAKIYFTDMMFNADPSCNIPEDICDRVGAMTVPVDLEAYLFPGPYSAGARVHLNAWGCIVVEGDRGEICDMYDSHAMEVDDFMWQHQDFLVVFAAGDYGTLAQDGTIASPATCKNCLSVGATYTWNQVYRSTTEFRDPVEDICSACAFPQYCSRSTTISGQFVQNSSVRDQLISSLDPCCNDTFQLPEYSLQNQPLAKGQMWMTLFPRNMSASAIRSFVIKTLGWSTGGTSIQYNIAASPCTSASGGCGNYPPEIQVFFVTGEDFGNYFKDPSARPDPCTTVYAGQYQSQAVGGNDPCLAGPQLAGCSKPACTSSNPIECIDPYCFQGYCTLEGEMTLWTAGCPPHTTCCDDSFLQSVCLNQPCTTTGGTLSGVFRTPTDTTLLQTLTSGLGVIVRNVGTTDVILSMNISFHERAYPCTLADCCAESKLHLQYSNRPFYPAACCAANYTASAGSIIGCTSCPTNGAPGECIAYEETNLAEFSSRGPAMENFLSNTGEKRFKPDLVAPGSFVASANSDGNTNTNGPLGEYWVQCGLPSSVSAISNGCSVSSAEAYQLSSAVITKSGTSSAAAFVAGAAVLIRQYLTEGWYPRGVRNESNLEYADPSSALLKAMLINSARSVGGTVVTYTYEQEPLSAQCVGCPTWIQPAPNISVIQLQSSETASSPPATPNMYQGFGRPILKNILWVAGAENSSYSLYLRQNSFSKAGTMHLYTFSVANQDPNPFGLQLKITMAYTDPPGTPGADVLLVNDLDLVVQKVVTSVVWDVNKAENLLQHSFVSTYGNAGGSKADMSNTVEEVLLYASSTEPDLINVTIIVVGHRLASSYLKQYGSQSYSLVVTGLLMTRIHYWRQIRTGILSIAGWTGGPDTEDDGIRKAFAVIDFLQKGYFTAENIWMRWNLIGMPSQDQTLADNLASEADVDQSGTVDLTEFTEIVYLLRLNSMQPRDPIFEEQPADPAFLGVNQSQPQAYDTSSSNAKDPPGWILAAAAMCMMAQGLCI